MNVIVLTTGLSGSSLITGLIGRAGFWSGDETVVKNNSTGQYETFENAALVDLNDRLIEQAGFEFSQTAWYQLDAREDFDRAYSAIDPSPYQQFLNDCNDHERWIWKDPKLWFTIGYWQHLIDSETTRVITVSRNSFNLWVSQTSKRIIYDYAYLARSETTALDALHAWLEQSGFAYLHLNFEQFASNPAASVSTLNEFLHTDLQLRQFDEIYRSPPKLETLKRQLTAWPIYLKNYSSRIR